MKQLIYVMVDLQDLMGSECFTDFTQSEFAAYLKLLFHCYSNGGSLPSGDRALSGLSGARSGWQKVKGRVLSKFYLDQSENRLRNARVDLEIQRVNAKSEHARTIGALGGIAKAQNSYQPLSVGQADAKQKPTASLPNRDIDIELELKSNTPLPPKRGGKAKALPMPIPTVEEVRAYMAEQGWSDPEYWAARFHSHYELNKWATSAGKKLQSWKHAVNNTWDKNKYEKRPAPKTNGIPAENKTYAPNHETPTYPLPKFG
jgi:uncharacterized protein YdaU (DUF1376 family)